MIDIIQLEKVKTEAEQLYPIDTRTMYIYFYFYGFLGLPFFYLGENKKGFTFIIISFLLLMLSSLSNDFLLVVLAGLAIAYYTYVYIYFLLKISNENKEQLKRRETYIKENYTNKISEFKDINRKELESEIALYKKRNPTFDKGRVSTFWLVLGAIGGHCFYLKEYKYGFSILLGLLLISISSGVLIVNIILKLSLIFYFFYHGFILNKKVENHNSEIRWRRMQYLNSLEKKFNQK